jgi:competence protein ComGC
MNRRGAIHRAPTPAWWATTARLKPRKSRPDHGLRVSWPCLGAGSGDGAWRASLHGRYSAVVDRRNAVARAGTVALDLLLLIAILTLLAFVTIPSWERSTTLSEIRQCYAIQRRLLAAVEAFEVDTGQPVGELTAFLPRLVQEGYLPGLPSDPGDDGPASFSHFGQSTRGTIYCWVHGSPWACGPRPVASPAPEGRPTDLSTASPRASPPGRHISPRKFPGLWR